MKLEERGNLIRKYPFVEIIMKIVEKSTVYTIGVLAKSLTINNDDEDKSGERFSYRGTTTTSWDIKGLILIDKEDQNYRYLNVEEQVDVLFKPEKGKIYHLLYAIYGTGDTFGHDNGKHFEVIGVYQDRKIAEENQQRLQTGKPEIKDKWGTRVSLLVEGINKTHDYHRPWTGYFESLNILTVESFILN